MWRISPRNRRAQINSDLLILNTPAHHLHLVCDTHRILTHRQYNSNHIYILSAYTHHHISSSWHLYSLISIMLMCLCWRSAENDVMIRDSPRLSPVSICLSLIFFMMSDCERTAVCKRDASLSTSWYDCTMARVLKQQITHKVKKIAFLYTGTKSSFLFLWISKKQKQIKEHSIYSHIFAKILNWSKKTIHWNHTRSERIKSL